MYFKKIGKAFLFPHIAILLLLLPTAIVFLIYAMLFLDEASPIRIASYILAFYTLTVCCMQLPQILAFLHTFKKKNPYLRRWLEDPRLRVNVTLIGNVIWNFSYAALQLGLGIYHQSAWFYSLFAYYCSLAVMRFFLVQHTLRHKPGEKLQQELLRYRYCGWIFLFMNLALSGMMLHMIRENRVMHHHEITTIAMAAYTFTTLTLAIINVIKYRKYESPAFSASKAISLASACVSMLTLENTMLDTFQTAAMTAHTRKIFLGISGGVISLFIIFMALYMILQSSRHLKNFVRI